MIIKKNEICMSIEYPRLYNKYYHMMIYDVQPPVLEPS